MTAITEMTDEQLEIEIKSYYSLIENEECFSVNDLAHYELLVREAEKRGYELRSHVCLVKCDQ